MCGTFSGQDAESLGSKRGLYKGAVVDKFGHRVNGDNNLRQITGPINARLM